MILFTFIFIFFNLFCFYSIFSIYFIFNTRINEILNTNIIYFLINLIFIFKNSITTFKILFFFSLNLYKIIYIKSKKFFFYFILFFFKRKKKRLKIFLKHEKNFFDNYLCYYWCLFYILKY